GKPQARSEIVVSRWRQRLRDARVARKYQTLGRKWKHDRLLSGHKGLNLSLRVIPRHADFPAQAEVQRKIGFYLPSILHEGTAVARARIKKLQSSLGVRAVGTDGGGPAQEEVRHIASRHRAIKNELPVRAGIVAFVHLQVAEFPSQLPCMSSLGFRKHVGSHIGGVGLERIERGHSNVQLNALEADLRHILFISGKRDNP